MTAIIDRPVMPPNDLNEQQELTDLAKLIEESDGKAAFVGADGTLVHLPAAVSEVLVQVIAAMRAGRAITIAPLAQRLTTQEAANLLGVSRPTLVKLLEDGEIPFEQPGRHRRVRLVDLLDYQARSHSERGKALDELIQMTEELGLYDDEPSA